METRLVIGCNYHTIWQSNKSMRFVLVEIKDGKAKLATRNTGKSFWTNIKDLIFIESDYNKNKASKIMDANIKIHNILDYIEDNK